MLYEVITSNELMATTQGVFLLGEALSASGQKEAAIERYRAVVEVDPNGRLGQAAARRLVELGVR